jgi:predicted nucleic acid-binding protein
VAAALPSHEDHAGVVDALPTTRTRLVAHVGLETYSVLTRLPPPLRLPPPIVLAYLREMFELPPATLEPRRYLPLLEIAAAERAAGGAIYDAVVAATAKDIGATLLTLDRRAKRTYELVGVEYRLLRD